ncbi:MAG: c-type cytochrome [Acidiferrobacterales bacterium]
MAILLVAAAAGSSSAAGERAQRFAVELTVLAIRSHRLLDTGLAPAQRARLRAKMNSALGVLPLLARSYLEERPRRGGRRLLAQLRRLRVAYAHRQLAAVTAELDQLSHRYPLDTRGLLPLPTAPLAMQAGRTLYRNLCMACHAYPDSGSPVPAPDLFAMARVLTPLQLVARLLGGVRGTPSTTLVNPLSNQNIADLAVFLRSGVASRR